MEKKFTFAGLLFVLFVLAAHAQDPFYKSFISGNMETWKDSLLHYKTRYAKSNLNADLEVIVTAQYGLIAYYIGNKQNELAVNELKQAQKNIGFLLSKTQNNIKFQAFKGALLGFEIALSPWKALIIGPESKSIIEESIRVEPNSPFANFEYANMLFWAPVIVGGNKEAALTYYNISVQLLEFQKNTHNWYYLWVLTAYANALKTIDRKNEALKVYEKIVHIEPNYTWVANELKSSKKTLPNLNF